MAVGIRQPYIRAVGFEVDTVGPGRSAGVPITPVEEEEFCRLSANPKIYDILSRSIAPSIYGSPGEFDSCYCFTEMSCSSQVMFAKYRSSVRIQDTCR